MNEVEKMYSNAGIEPIVRDNAIGRGYYIEHQRVEDYPSFTAKKQLHLIKWLSDKADYVDIHYDRYKGLFKIQTGMGGLYVCNEFEQALASRVNIIWQDLTEEERKQIKNILESEVRE